MNDPKFEDIRKKQVNQIFIKVIGVSFCITGILAILVSLNILEYVDLRPNRIAIFNDPHTWEVFAFGVCSTSFGIANLLSPKKKIFGKINIAILIISFLAVLLAVILRKTGTYYLIF